MNVLDDSRLTFILQGGAFAEEGYSDNRFETSSFYKNKASYGGALYLEELSSTKSLGNTFESNDAVDGGAIYSAGFTTCVDSTFESNSAETVSFWKKNMIGPNKHFISRPNLESLGRSCLHPRWFLIDAH